MGFSFLLWSVWVFVPTVVCGSWWFGERLVCVGVGFRWFACISCFAWVV